MENSNRNGRSGERRGASYEEGRRARERRASSSVEGQTEPARNTAPRTAQPARGAASGPSQPRSREDAPRTRPHGRTGELPRVEGVRYLDSTGSVPKVEQRPWGRSERVRAERSRQSPRAGRSRSDGQRQTNGWWPAAGVSRQRLVVGVTAAVVVVLVVLISWGCTRKAAADRAADEAARQQQEAQEEAEQAQQPASDLDGVEPGTYYVVLMNESNTSLCLSASGNEDDDYTVMQLGSTGYNASRQRLTLSIVDSTSCTLSTEDGLYVDAGDATAGPGLRLYANASNDADGQRWELEHATGGYRIVNKETGWVIEAPRAASGAELVTNTEDAANTNQVFRFVPAEDAGSNDASSSAGSK